MVRRPETASAEAGEAAAVRAAVRRLTYQMRMADDLMHYTRMKLAEVALRSGIGSPLNLNQSYRREYDLTPGERRRQLRQNGDAGRYRL